MKRQRIAVFRFQRQEAKERQQNGNKPMERGLEIPLSGAISELILCCLQNAGEVAQQLRELSALARIKSSILSTHIM